MYVHVYVGIRVQKGTLFANLIHFDDSIATDSVGHDVLTSEYMRLNKEDFQFIV